MALTASNLTSRKWNGVLAIYSDPHFAPAVPHIDIGVETEAGGSDVTWIDEKRLLVASDSGAVDLWTVVDNGRAMENTLSYLEHSGICSSICLNNSKQQVVSGSYDGRYALASIGCINLFGFFFLNLFFLSSKYCLSPN